MIQRLDVENNWKKVISNLSTETTLKLPKGSEFTAISDSGKSIITITPKQSGISRIIGKKEWIRFAERFNEVIDSGYDPLRPGHYARISFNASYLIAIIKACINQGQIKDIEEKQ